MNIFAVIFAAIQTSEGLGDGYTEVLYPKGYVYYMVNYQLAGSETFIAKLYRVLYEIQRATCVRFMRSRYNTNGSLLFIQTGSTDFFDYGDSIVGVYDDHTVIFYGLLRALGLYHEQSRRDRPDQFHGKIHNLKYENWPPIGITYPPYSVLTTLNWSLKRELLGDCNELHDEFMDRGKLERFVPHDTDRVMAIYSLLARPADFDEVYHDFDGRRYRREPIPACKKRNFKGKYVSPECLYN